MRKLTIGYTLIEILVSLLIVAIVGGIAVPSFNTMINKNTQTSSLNTFIGSLHFARSEAVKRSRQVVLCPSTDKLRCNFAHNWDSGWIAFIDSDQDISRDVDEEVIKIENGFSNGYTLKGSADVADYIRFRGDGFTRESGEFVICDPRGSGSAKVVIVSISGKTRTSEKSENGDALSCS